VDVVARSDQQFDSISMEFPGSFMETAIIAKGLLLQYRIQG
jgi:hypothetical protein